MLPQKTNVGQKPPPNNHSHYQGIPAIEKLSDIYPDIYDRFKDDFDEEDIDY